MERMSMSCRALGPSGIKMSLHGNTKSLKEARGEPSFRSDKKLPLPALFHPGITTANSNTNVKTANVLIHVPQSTKQRKFKCFHTFILKILKLN